MTIEKCPFCDKDVAEISNCQESEECRHFEKCPATEPYVCVVCNMHEGGCGASSGYYDSEAKAIAAWNCRTPDVVYCRECKHSQQGTIYPMCLYCYNPIYNGNGFRTDDNAHCSYGERL